MDGGGAGERRPRRGLRRAGRRWRRETVASAAALAALLNAAACGSEAGTAGSTTTSADTSLPSTTLPTTAAPATTLPATTATTAKPPATTAASRVPVTTVPAVTARPSTSTTVPPSTTTSLPCYTDAYGQTTCAVPGRPLRRWRRRGLLLPAGAGEGRAHDEARAEYASVASFGELALRLLAVGAPARLVAACHEAALDEIRHAALCDELAGRAPSAFGAIPGLAGRRLGGWLLSRKAQVRRLAVESFLDGWVNEGAAAADLRRRAAEATAPGDRDRLAAMAEDEQRHADLARSIITWCFDEEPAAVGRALARLAPVAA